jgi:hypothetical protein
MNNSGLISLIISIFSLGCSIISFIFAVYFIPKSKATNERLIKEMREKE